MLFYLSLRRVEAQQRYLFYSFYPVLGGKEFSVEACRYDQKCLIINVFFLRELGWCSGEGDRFPPLWPRFDSWTWHNMWVEFVALFVVLGPRKGFFSMGPSVFLPSQKLTSQIAIRPGNSEQEEPPGMSNAKFPLKSIFICLFYSHFE